MPESASASPSVSPSISPSPSPSISPSKSPSVSPSPSPSAEYYSVVLPTSSQQIKKTYIVKWTGLHVTGDSGAPFACPNYTTKSVQVIGTFGGATVTLEGSNIITSPTYATLTYDGTNNIAISSAGIKKVHENTYWIRPIISAAGATTDLDVYLLVYAG